MEWNIKTTSPHCDVCGTPFFDKEEILSLVLKTGEGGFQRFDVSKKCANAIPLKGEIIGQWRHVFFNKNNSAILKSKQEIASQEEFFISLYEEQGSKEKDILKQFFALLLEKKRVLKRVSETNDTIKFIHTRDKREFIVSNKDFSPEELTSIANIFEMLP